VKVDFEQPVKTINGIPMVEPVEGEVDDEGNQKVRPVTLRTAVVNALLAQFQDEKSLSGEEKLKRWDLARKVHGGCDTLEVEEVALIKTLVGKAYGVAVVGPVYTMLEGDA